MNNCKYSVVCLYALSLLLELPWTVFADEAPVSVRVRPTPGGPQILVDGKPAVPRWFFGNPAGGGQVMAGPDWNEQSFEFVPAEDVKGRGTLHFRFGHNPGMVWLADVKVSDASSGKEVLAPKSFASPKDFQETWNIWPRDKANTVGKVEPGERSVKISLSNPPGGKWPDFHLYSDIAMKFQAGRTYRCSFRVRARPSRRITPAIYSVEDGVWDRVGSPPGTFLQQVELARDAGVRFITFSSPGCWSPPGEETDYARMDRLFLQILHVYPEALLIPRVGANAPSWWLKAHPDAAMKYEGNVTGHRASVSNRVYRADVASYIERLSRHLSETFPRNFAGIHPCGQNTGEWFYEDTWRRPLNGYDPGTARAWEEWRKARGLDPAVPVPTARARRTARLGMLWDPEQESARIDFARFQQEEMAEMVLALAAAARRGTAGKKLVVFFYGYHYEFGSVPNGAPISGHYGLWKVLPSRDIDILCSPLSYSDRQWLGTAPCMSPAESIRDSSKMWLNEDDTRTFLSAQKTHGALADLRQTREVMLRNTAQAALRGFATWWMDLPGQGWFNDARIWEILAKLRPVDEAMLQRARPFNPDIAAIVGEDSMCHLPPGSNAVTRPLISLSRSALGRCGAPYGQFLLTRAIAGKVPARLQIFLAAWSLTPAQRARLKSNRKPGTTRVWCYAPGFLLPERADASAMEGVCGFRCRQVKMPTSKVSPKRLGRQRGLKDNWGTPGPIRPLFAADAAPEETWATYSDGSPAVAVRKMSSGYDVFIGVPQLTPELVRALARLAGVHLFTDVNTALWAAEGRLSIHALEEGPLRIHTGREGPIKDALTGAPLGHGPEIDLPIHKGETMVLRF